MDSTCFQVRSIKEKEKHGKYSVEVRSEEYSTQYMKIIWKLQCEFAYARRELYVCALLRFDIVK